MGSRMGIFFVLSSNYIDKMHNYGSSHHHQDYFGPYTFDDAIRIIFTGGITDLFGTWSGPGNRVGIFCVNHQGNVSSYCYGSQLYLSYITSRFKLY